MVQATLSKTEDINEFLTRVKSFINDNDCPDLTVDMTHLNILDTARASAICSTYHWAKYPEGEIRIKTGAPEINRFVESLCFDNVCVTNEIS